MSEQSNKIAILIDSVFARTTQKLTIPEAII